MLEQEKKSITWFTESQPLNEGVSQGVSVALLGHENKQACKFMHCRDWTQDSGFAAVNKMKVGIYGFTYDPAKHPALNFDKMTMLVANSEDNDFKAKLPNCITFLRKVEEMFGLARSKVYECENPPKEFSKCGVYLFEGSKRWMTAPSLLSMYSLLIRSSFHCPMDMEPTAWLEQVATGKASTYVSADKHLWTNARITLEWFSKYGIYKFLGQDLKENYPVVASSTMHNGMGIQSYALYTQSPPGGDSAAYYKMMNDRLKAALEGKTKKKKTTVKKVATGEPDVIKVKELVNV